MIYLYILMDSWLLLQPELKFLFYASIINLWLLLQPELKFLFYASIINS